MTRGWAVLLVVTLGWCANAKAEQPALTAPAESPPADAATTPDARSPAEAQAAVAQPVMTDAQAAAALNGRRWGIELRAMFENGPAGPLADGLVFESGKVRSERLGERGYAPSRFTVTVAESGVPVWETMQTSPQDGIVLWRGELHGEQMLGSLSRYPLEGYSEDFVFEGHPAEAAPAQAQTDAAAAAMEPAQPGADAPQPGGDSPQAQEPAVQAAPEPASVTSVTPEDQAGAQEQTTKPRKRWFRNTNE